MVCQIIDWSASVKTRKFSSFYKRQIWRQFERPVGTLNRGNFTENKGALQHTQKYSEWQQVGKWSPVNWEICHIAQLDFQPNSSGLLHQTLFVLSNIWAMFSPVVQARHQPSSILRTYLFSKKNITKTSHL